MPILGRVIDILGAAGKDTAVDMAALLKREALDVIGGPLPLYQTAILGVAKQGQLCHVAATLSAKGVSALLHRPGGLWV